MGSLSSNRAWVTLLTRESYLPGAVLLAHSLHKQNSKYPLIILYTPTLPKSMLPALARECKLTNASLRPTSMLQPRGETTLIAERFKDTWTKLRVFELVTYERICFLDADMLVLRNMDEIFDVEFPDDGSWWLAASHVCVCNLDNDSWAPADWKKENCAFGGSSHPTALTHPPAARKTGTHSLLNGGLFVFAPSQELWGALLEFLNSSPLVSGFMFPDQDLLAEFFRGRWLSVGWQYNALKTWRYWHPEFWQDGEVRNLHYIVDKPWARRVGRDGKAGYLGKDGVTHGWWWREFAGWVEERRRGGGGNGGGGDQREVSILELVGALVDGGV